MAVQAGGKRQKQADTGQAVLGALRQAGALQGAGCLISSFLGGATVWAGVCSFLCFQGLADPGEPLFVCPCGDQRNFARELISNGSWRPPESRKVRKNHLIHGVFSLPWVHFLTEPEDFLADLRAILKQESDT